LWVHFAKQRPEFLVGSQPSQCRGAFQEAVSHNHSSLGDEGRGWVALLNYGCYGRLHAAAGASAGEEDLEEFSPLTLLLLSHFNSRFVTHL
jgi:hypothetical protein